MEIVANAIGQSFYLRRLTFMVATSICVGLAFWFPLRNETRKHIIHMTALSAQSVRTDIADEIRAQMLAQMRLGQLWSREDKLPDSDLENQARLFMRHNPGCLSLQIVDTDQNIGWGVSAEPQTYRNPRLLTSDHLAQLFQYFAANPEADPYFIVPDIAESSSGARAVVTPISTYRNKRRALIALFDETRNLQAVLEDHIDLGYGITILDGQESIFTAPARRRNLDEEFAQEAELPFSGMTWRVRVWPESDLLNSVRSNLPTLAFATGATISLLLFIALDFARTSLRRGRALRLSQERLHGIVSSAMDAIITVDENQRIIVFNAAAEEMFHWKASEVVGKSIDTFIPARFKAIHGQHIRNFGQAGTTKRSMSPADLWAVRSNGEEFPIEASISQVNTGIEQLYTVIMRDISARRQSQEALLSAHLELERRVHERTVELKDANRRLEDEIQERKQAEESLRELSGRLLRLRDEEQKRIARELHDSTVQTLGAVAIDLDKLKSILRDCDQKTNRLLTGSAKLVDNAISELRTLSYLLHPPILDDLGLEEVLPWYAAGFSSRSGIEVDVDVQPNIGRLPREMELAIFRILQEALTNIHRHSGSTRAELRFSKRETFVTLEINDHGKGRWKEHLQDSKKTLPVVGVGIAGMRERVRQLGGHFEIVTGPQGTLVRVVLNVGVDSDEPKTESSHLHSEGFRAS